MSGRNAGISFGRRLSLKRSDIKSYILLAPIVLLLLIAFVVPVANLLSKAVWNPEIPELLPRTVSVLDDWDGEDLPPEAAYVALREDLSSNKSELGTLARRLNTQHPGMRRILLSTANGMNLEAVDAKADVIGANKAWGDRDVWLLLRQERSYFTWYYLLASVGLKQDQANGITFDSTERTPFLAVFVRTFGISLSVTAICLAVGYPYAWAMANASPFRGRLLLLFVLLPFWMSLLVRTTGWIILLQQNGPINVFLLWLGLISEPLQLVFNRVGVIVAMGHTMFPFMILPIYAVIRGISPIYMKAAGSLGAHPWRAFWSVYLPMSLPGVISGCMMTWILALGYYITPALVGGSGDQMISYYIAFFTNESLNWGQAAALAWLLLMAALLSLLLFRKLGGSQTIRVS